MAIRIDVKELLDVLRLTPPEQNVMLIGKHGIGKSEIIRRFYEQERHMKIVAFFLGQMSDPGDLIGLMHKDEQTGRSIFLPPYWWPMDGQPIVLFLDELNRARPEILQSVHELALNKTLAGKRLPEGSIVVSAVNEGDEYQLTDLDPALVSRFNLYEFAPTVEDWLLWAAENEVDERVTTFIQQNNQYLDGDEKAGDEDQLTAHAGLVKTPDRRAWVKVANLIKPLERIEDVHIKIIAGMVGTSAAMMFKKSLVRTLPVTPEQVLLQLDKCKKRLKKLALQDLVLLNEQIVI
jgi:MoxR-like ATPase